MQLSARDIAERLAARVDDVAEMLLPNGKQDGRHWIAGSVHGKMGKSLKVCLSGDRAGRWKDFAVDGDFGDLLDLWMKTRGLSLPEAIAKAKAYLGIRTEPPRFAGTKQQSFKRPESPKQAKLVQEGSTVMRYLTETRRLSQDAIEAYRLMERSGEMVFPYYRADELIFVKYRQLPRGKGEKQIRVEANCEPVLFGWQAIPKNARRVFITEGEIDAMTLWDYGFPALSVPFGGGGGKKQDWIATEFDQLALFDEIILFLDADQPGREAVAEIVKRLGAHRCRVVEPPPGIKDANELAQAGWSNAQAAELLKQAGTLDPKELRSAASYVEAVIEMFYPSEGIEPGFCMPWQSAQWLRFRPSELIILSGVNGHGKSQAVGQIILEVMGQGDRACIASMELLPKRLLQRLTRQAAAFAEPSEEYIRAIHHWYDGKLWIFDETGTAKAARLLEVFAYARARYGIRLFVIDSLMKCGIAEDDYAGQKAFVEQLADFKLQYDDCTIFLVTHSRKRESEATPTDKFDVKGSGGITDLADTVITVWRNKPKEEKLDECARRKVEPDAETTRLPDALWICQKQRNGEREGTIALWWHGKSLQFLPSSKHPPKRFVEFSVLDRKIPA